MQSRFLFFITCGLLSSYHQILRQLKSVRPMVRIYCAWRSRNFRASAHFAIRVFGKMFENVCFPPALKQKDLAGGCAKRRKAGDGMTTSAGETSVELENILANLSVNGCSHSGDSVSIRSSWSLTACVCLGSSLVWCSVACTPGATK